MISRLSGTLDCITEDGRAMLQSGPITYEVLVPAADIEAQRDRTGQEVVFHTLHYLEGQSQGSTMLPRLIGFSSDLDRSFFTLFTTVKNIGYRKALRALQRPCREIASAIAAKDTTTLTSLPEIGKRSAETIVAELHGKVDPFLEGLVEPFGKVDPFLEGLVEPSSPIRAGENVPPLVADAIALLTTLGESRTDARRRAELAFAAHPDVEGPEQLLQIIYTMKEPVS
ncbi:MAG: Holliday junction branch migration protein RuvA [Planctomycetota bacterium]|nr:Holliday junction branch migration protein RuvA [Planctomycetota bacterium]